MLFVWSVVTNQNCHRANQSNNIEKLLHFLRNSSVPHRLSNPDIKVVYMMWTFKCDFRSSSVKTVLLIIFYDHCIDVRCQFGCATSQNKPELFTSQLVSMDLRGALQAFCQYRPGEHHLTCSWYPCWYWVMAFLSFVDKGSHAPKFCGGSGALLCSRGQFNDFNRCAGHIVCLPLPWKHMIGYQLKIRLFYYLRMKKGRWEFFYFDITFRNRVR